MSGGRMSGGRMSGGRLSGGLMSGGLMSAHRNSQVQKYLRTATNYHTLRVGWLALWLAIRLRSRSGIR